MLRALRQFCAAKARRVRGLRFRLVLSYVIFFGLLLVGTGLLFRETLRKTISDRSSAVLAEEWAAIKGYLRITPQGEAQWAFDAEDPEEAFIVERLRRILFIHDPVRRETVEISNGYLALGEDSDEEIAAALRSREPLLRTKFNSRDDPYLVRQGLMRDGGHSYFLAIGLPVSSNQQILADFTRTYLVIVPAMLLASVLLGWYLSGRALQPVNELAQATRRISASSLNLRLNPRGTRDEVDALIQTFNGMMDRLEANFEQMRQFTTDASHELRTPLTAIRGQLEVALFTARTPEEYRAAMVNALEDVERLGQIVKSLLQLSQAESGQVMLQKLPEDLAQLTRDAVQQLLLPAEEKRVHIETKLELPVVAEVDRVQFERLLFNLLSNAIKYTPAGGTVTVTAEPREEHAVLTIRDDGPGIPAEHLPHIFDRFYRVPTRDEGPERGLGLGLSFVAWIAKAHGGSVAVQSNPGEGACFEVLFPRTAPSNSAAP